MPVAIVWSVFLLIKMINRDGMAVLMSGFVSVVILISVVFLVIDRIVSTKINLWWLALIEVLTLIVSWKMINLYLYDQ